MIMEINAKILEEVVLIYFFIHISEKGSLFLHPQPNCDLEPKLFK